jgi:hypothetical protein
MPRFHTSVAIWATLTLLAPCAFGASLTAATDAPEKTVPQGNGPPGAENDAQSSPATKHKGVITPPKTGDEGIYTEAPNPNAGTKEEVIPPPGTPGGDPNIEPR